MVGLPFAQLVDLERGQNVLRDHPAPTRQQVDHQDDQQRPPLPPLACAGALGLAHDGRRQFPRLRGRHRGGHSSCSTGSGSGSCSAASFLRADLRPHHHLLQRRQNVLHRERGLRAVQVLHDARGDLSLRQRLEIDEIRPAGDRNGQAVLLPPDRQRVLRKGKVARGKIESLVGLGVDFRARAWRAARPTMTSVRLPSCATTRPVEDRRLGSARLQAAQFQLQRNHSGELLRVGFVQPERQAKDLRHRQRQRRVFAQPVVQRTWRRSARAWRRLFRPSTQSSHGSAAVGPGSRSARWPLVRERTGFGFYCSDHRKY